MATSREERKNISGPEGDIGTGGGGSNDPTSGGGAGGGTPDADTAMRAGDAVTGGDLEKDRKKLFPESDERSERPHAMPPPKGG